VCTVGVFVLAGTTAAGLQRGPDPHLHFY
jgi:hypothetical protein